jgi:peroxiredoxin
VVVIGETILLLLLLRTLGALKQQGMLQISQNVASFPPPPPGFGGPEVGEHIHLFRAIDQDKRVIDIAQLNGKQYILAFLSTTCPACSSTAEALQKTAIEHPELRILIVADADLEKNRRFAAQHNLTIPVLTPEPELVQTIYKIGGFPLVFLIDEDQKVQKRGIINNYNHLMALLASVSAKNSDTSLIWS